VGVQRKRPVEGGKEELDESFEDDEVNEEKPAR
jgi:hypothetical protein